ncbi:Protein ALTERED PHOSPHATE STARVATION RESPONSE 1 [Linum perenne]
MGCFYSRIEREEMVSRCKARKKYLKQLLQARQFMSTSHVMYLRALRSTGSALIHFSNIETNLHHHHNHLRHNYTHSHNHHLQPAIPSPSPPLPPLPPPPPPMSPSSDTTWTSISASPLPPPPPPPMSQTSSWDFWDPFVQPPPSATRTEEWEEVTTMTVSEAAVTASASITAPPSVVSGLTTASGSGSELAMVVSRNSKDLVEIVKEVDEYFLKAADGGAQLSLLLEVPTSGFSTAQIKGGKVYNYGCNLTSPSSWSWSSSGMGKMADEIVISSTNIGGERGGFSHCSTVERMYAWEKKLFQEVKNAESIKIEHEKKVGMLRKLEMKRADYLKTEKTKKEVEKFESQMMVASQAIESTSSEIIKLRETELYPQLLELVKGLMCMWRSMYECHQVQTHIVQQLKYLNTIPSTEPTSEIHRQSTLQLELQVQQWHQSFCNLVKSQRDYIQSLTSWLRLSLFQFSKSPLSKTIQESKIYSLCDEWLHAIDRIPDKVASEGIKSFLTVIHAIVVQQAEEHKQKKKLESALKEFEKKAAELRSLETKYGPYSIPESSGSGSRSKNPVRDKRVKVEILRARAEEEKTKHEKSVSITRAMTLNNLQMGFPHVFQAIVGFSSVCMHAFESVYNQAKAAGQEHEVKRIMG